MVKAGALLLLLAVAASQVDLSLSQVINGSGEVNISSCPITFYGRKYSVMENASAVVGNSSLGSWSYNTSVGPARGSVDVSGCRLSDGVLASGSSMLSPGTCSNFTCSVSAVLSRADTCGPLEVCLGNNICHQPPIVCTVTGSTVIDFFGRVNSIGDRCAYNLMRPLGSTSFVLLARFRERRRTDVSFLDHLIIRIGGVDIYLEQGGRVRINDQVQALNSTVQLAHGVELWKDQRGVSARIVFPNMTIFFDGNTAHVSGNLGHYEGLCGSPTNSSHITTLRAAKSFYNISGCGLLKQGLFSDCHLYVDPEPHITACRNTLCSYPTLDGLGCQFFEAYVKACSLRSNIMLVDWRSTTGCSAAPHACLVQHCSSHEFCALKFGQTHCRCRALFASKHRATDTLGEPTVCTQNSATLSLAGCLLEDRAINSSALHLNDKNCTGDIDSETHMVTFSFNTSSNCGAEVVTNGTQVIYKNAVMTGNSSLSDVITRHNQLVIDFSCLYNKPEVKTVAFKIRDGSVVQHIVSGLWNYTVIMNAYNDSGLSNLIGLSNEIQLNQKIWVELSSTGLDDELVALVTTDCWATNVPSSNGSVRYNLIQNGCPNPADLTVQVKGNGVGTSNSFSFDMFEFSGKNNEVYLHCKLELCLKKSNTCPQSCGGGAWRRRRSSRYKRADEHALITMAWTHSVDEA
ncbi:alpha-tectorin-like [Chelmon rostratus]|uniref:alpha-tectorin-like n=1 Tax=Chelmon rostratus TaxID=109905 RepID=UPI001BE6ECCD|nr:alpha-tectorin-like [Chelmon rostratus]